MHVRLNSFRDMYIDNSSEQQRHKKIINEMKND